MNMVKRYMILKYEYGDAFLWCKCPSNAANWIKKRKYLRNYISIENFFKPTHLTDLRIYDGFNDCVCFEFEKKCPNSLRSGKILSWSWLTWNLWMNVNYNWAGWDAFLASNWKSDAFPSTISIYTKFSLICHWKNSWEKFVSIQSESCLRVWTKS